MKTKREVCGSCDYFEHIGDMDRSMDGWGACKRFPPVKTHRTPRDHESSLTHEAKFPLVNHQEWCGEFRLAFGLNRWEVEKKELSPEEVRLEIFGSE